MISRSQFVQKPTEPGLLQEHATNPGACRDGLKEQVELLEELSKKLDEYFQITTLDGSRRNEW
jgi:hypothetical protein